MATDDHFYPSLEFIALVETHDLPPIRRTISIPDKHDAAVYLTPDGHGDLTTATVPDDCTVAILPPGARIVQPSEPKRKRPACWRPYIPARHRAVLEPLIADWLAAQEKENQP